MEKQSRLCRKFSCSLQNRLNTFSRLTLGVILTCMVVAAQVNAEQGSDLENFVPVVTPSVDRCAATIICDLDEATCQRLANRVAEEDKFNLYVVQKSGSATKHLFRLLAAGTVAQLRNRELGCDSLRVATIESARKASKGRSGILASTDLLFLSEVYPRFFSSHKLLTKMLHRQQFRDLVLDQYLASERQQQSRVATQAFCASAVFKTNTSFPADVNGDGYCAPIDVLILINFINRAASGGELTTFSNFYLDPNGDCSVNQSDINFVLSCVEGVTRAPTPFPTAAPTVFQAPSAVPTVVLTTPPPTVVVTVRPTVFVAPPVPTVINQPPVVTVRPQVPPKGTVPGKTTVRPNITVSPFPPRRPVPTYVPPRVPTIVPAPTRIPTIGVTRTVVPNQPPVPTKIPTVPPIATPPILGDLQLTLGSDSSTFGGFASADPQILGCGLNGSSRCTGIFTRGETARISFPTTRQSSSTREWVSFTSAKCVGYTNGVSQTLTSSSASFNLQLFTSYVCTAYYGATGPTTKNLTISMPSFTGEPIKVYPRNSSFPDVLRCNGSCGKNFPAGNGVTVIWPERIKVLGEQTERVFCSYSCQTAAAGSGQQFGANAANSNRQHDVYLSGDTVCQANYSRTRCF